MDGFGILLHFIIVTMAKVLLFLIPLFISLSLQIQSQDFFENDCFTKRKTNFHLKKNDTKQTCYVLEKRVVVKKSTHYKHR